MTIQKNDKNNLDQPLLSDDDFLKLMEAEYSSRSSGINELEKRRTWQAIKKGIRPEAAVIKPRWQPLAAMGILVVAIWPIWNRFQNNQPFNFKGHDQYFELELSSYVLESNGSIAALQYPEPGQTLIFKTTNKQAAYLALVLKREQEAPRLAFLIDQAIAGSDRLLEKENKTYAYQVQASDQVLIFCLLAAAELADLQKQIEHISETWQSIPSSSCQELRVK